MAAPQLYNPPPSGNESMAIVSVLYGCSEITTYKSVARPSI